MQSNNNLLKNIAKNTGSDDTNGHHSNNYYLKRIENNTKSGSSSGSESSNMETVTFVITYSDNSSENITLYKQGE